MITSADLVKVRVRRKAAKAIDRILTPPEILDQEIFDEPEVITQRYFNFNNLLLHRHKIRNLRLMPLKEEGLHDEYNSLSRQDLLDRIKTRIGLQRLALLPNEYPYQLPRDVLQCILWIQDETVSRREIVRFLARMLHHLQLDMLDVIFFERSTTSRSKYVKRSFPLMRHVHVWIRKSKMLEQEKVLSTGLHFKTTMIK